MSILSYLRIKPKSATVHIAQQILSTPARKQGKTNTLDRMAKEIAEMAKDPAWLAFVEKEKAKEEKKKRNTRGSKAK